MTKERRRAAGRDSMTIMNKSAEKQGMTPETKTILTVVVIAILVFAFYVWGFTKDGVPAYGLWLVAGFIVFFSVLALNSLLPGAEEKLARRLAAGVGRPASGIVTELRRRGSLETSSQRFSYVTLIVDMEAEGKTRTVTIKAKIEDSLMPGFATGRRISLLYDPDDPSSAAIDREHNPVSIQ